LIVTAGKQSGPVAPAAARILLKQLDEHIAVA